MPKKYDDNLRQFIEDRSVPRMQQILPQPPVELFEGETATADREAFAESWRAATWLTNRIRKALLKRRAICNHKIIYEGHTDGILESYRAEVRVLDRFLGYLPPEGE